MPPLFDSAVFIGSPGRWRDSLRVLLQARGEIAQIDFADDVFSGLNRISLFPPELVLVDASLPDDGAWFAVTLIRRELKSTRCMVLVHTQEQEQKARSYGADAVLQVGFSAEALHTTLERLLAVGTTGSDSV